MQNFKYSQYNIAVESDLKHTTLYNCYSGGIIKLENDIYRRITENTNMEKSMSYVKDLIANGFLVNANVNEYQRVKMQLDDAINMMNQTTISYTIAPTLNCNMDCVYCFEKHQRKAHDNISMTEETLDNIVHFILQSSKFNSNVKNIKITWFGGEPLLCYEQIVRLNEKLKSELGKRGIYLATCIITNGLLLDEAKLKVLTQECNLLRLQITLDGEQATYCEKKQTSEVAYKKVIENICMATNYVKTVVRVNADKSNYEELKNVALALFNMTTNKDNLRFHFAQLRNYNHDREGDFFDDYEYWQYKRDFYSMLEQKVNYKFTHGQIVPSFSRKPFCGIALKNNFVIDYNGNLYKCEHKIGQIDYVVGDVFDGVYYNAAYQDATRISVISKCKSCNIFPICNYAQCSVMQNLTGEESCKCYESQLQAVKQIVKNYKEVV